MKKKDLLGIFLAAVCGIAFLTARILKTFLPRIILPNLDANTVVVLSLAAILLDHYIAKGSRRDYRVIPVYAALSFGLFSYTAGFTAPLDALILAVIGAAIFTALTFVFDTIVDRLSSGKASKLAPIAAAFGLFLAAQCLMGII